MKQIFEIALREIRSLFYSPLGWITLLIFALHTSLVILGRIDFSIQSFVLRGVEVDNYSARYYTHYMAYFDQIASSLYYYIPLLTMGLISKEYSQGSIKLLLSSPVKNYEVVFGKYISMLFFATLMVSIIILQALIIRLFVIDSIDFLLVTNGIVTIFLLICLYAAIGLFVSSLTTFQIVAAVGTFATLFVLNQYISTIVQPSHWVIFQEIFGNWLPPRTKWFQVNSQVLRAVDIYYFIILISLFLIFTYLKLYYMRVTSSIKTRFLTFTSVLILAFGIGLYSSHPDRFSYIDMTDSGLMTPSAEQKNYLEKIQHPLILSRYYNILESPFEGSVTGPNSKKSNINRLRSYLKIKPNLTYYPYVAPTDALSAFFIESDSTLRDASQMVIQTANRARRTSEGYDLSELKSIAISKYAWLKQKDIISYEDLKKFTEIPTLQYHNFYFLSAGSDTIKLYFGAGFPTDQEFTAALKKFVDGPKLVGVLFENGEYEPDIISDRSYQRVFNNPWSQYSLINQGFEINRTTIDDSKLKDIDILVIADPQIVYKNSDINSIHRFIDDGGNLLIASSISSREIINEIINSLGLSINDGTIDAEYGQILRDAVQISQTDSSGILINKIMKYRNRNDKLFNNEEESNRVSIRGASSVSIITQNKEFNSYPILVAGDDTLMYGLQRTINGKDQRIIVSGAASSFSNAAEGIGFFSPYSGEIVNFALLVSLFRWLSNDEYPVLVERELNQEKLILHSSNTFKISVLLFFSLPFIVFGSIVVLRRKQK